MIDETKPTIALDHDQVVATILQGDNCNGAYVLAVAPDGSDATVNWAETNRQWDPWPNGYLIASIPALDPEGSGRASEDAEDMLRCALRADKFHHAKARHDTGDIGWIDLAEELAPEAWNTNRQESALWIAKEWLRALNGEPNDLDPQNNQPWGDVLYDDEGNWDPRNIKPPATFEWQTEEAHDDDDRLINHMSDQQNPDELTYSTQQLSD